MAAVLMVSGSHKQTHRH